MMGIITASLVIEALVSVGILFVQWRALDRGRWFERNIGILDANLKFAKEESTFWQRKFELALAEKVTIEAAAIADADGRSSGSPTTQAREVHPQAGRIGDACNRPAASSEEGSASHE